MTKNDAVERAIEFAEGLKSLRDNVGTQLQQCDLHTIALADALQALQTSRPDADKLAALDAFNTWADSLAATTSIIQNQELFDHKEKIRAALKSGDKGRL